MGVGLFERLRGLGVGLGDGCVGGTLREHERAAQRVLGLATTTHGRGACLGTIGTVNGFA
ncbi:unannotated protein [freshwater metagenome]|uniref:Unannotated protein n=1 Tax=freshwater metagenome TaxID=449393 RepID=A0A6J7J431_9ZZZZ